MDQEDSPTNDELLQMLCRKVPDGCRAWVTSFSGDPERGDWRGHAHDPSKPTQWDAEANNYFSIAAMKPGAQSRDRNNFGALLAVVLDDIGTKVPLNAPRPEPSWIFETSPGNFQYGYLLRDPIDDKRRADRLIGGLRGKGVSDDGGVSIVRYMRLPVGANWKPEHVAKNGGEAPRTRVVKWNPERLFADGELAEALDISLEQGRGRPKSDSLPIIGPQDDPFFKLFEKLGLLTGKATGGGWCGMICPWEHEHTTADGGTSCAYLPGGGWKCLHGHCAGRRFSDVCVWLREKHGIDTDALLNEMPGSFAPLIRAADRYTYSMDVKTFVDLRTGGIVAKEALDDFYFSVMGGPKFTKWLLLRRDLRRVERTTYRPGAPQFTEEGGEGAVNLWLPGRVQPATTVDAERVGIWLRHLEWLVPDERDRVLVLDFLTHLVQRRGEKINWALLLLARVQGTGRDTLITPIRRILGEERNVSYVTGAMLESEFNDYIQKELVSLSELDTADSSRWKIYKRLKDQTACPPDYIGVNIKYIPSRMMPNVANYIILTNDPAALAFEEDDRRFAVVEIHRTKVQAREYAAAGVFRALHAAYAEGGWLENLYTFLQARKISEFFEPKGNAPDTVAKERMRRAAEAPEKTLLREWIERGEAPFEGDLFEVNSVLCALQGAGFHAANMRLAEMYLRDLGAVSLGRVRVGDERRGLWAVRDVERYMSMAPNVLASAYKRGSGLLT